MRLDPEQQATIRALLAEAHGDGTVNPRRAAADFLASVRDLERYGARWVDDYLSTLLLAGAQKACAGWRRQQGATETRTPKTGAPVVLAGYAGVRSLDDDGSLSYVQVPFPEMDLEALKAHRAKIAAPRDTASRQLAVIDACIAAMEADSNLTTTADALHALGLVAA